MGKIKKIEDLANHKFKFNMNSIFMSLIKNEAMLGEIVGLQTEIIANLSGKSIDEVSQKIDLSIKKRQLELYELYIDIDK
ncbi:hypothetical protein [Pedobacter sp. Hv1]|uniref:hypothetical protein n=1 Tax=Pedobacter sp. Hv1 TaxID=1740090 RepID=UPI0006D8A43F|nr:hypothetical protein [Pedobacter sp. Hv1]KQC02055.1 hypothetical protein AQF98_00335 [Pedobacter sp. Hv1]